MKLVPIICLLVIGGVCSDKNALKISIYYETLCPDSIRFFRQQFSKTYEEFLPYVNVDFVPYGHAEHKLENGKWNIKCQHGPKECEGNIYHACALAQNNGHEKDVQFISCSMSTINPPSKPRLVACAEEAGIPFEPIESCYQSDEGLELFVKNGEQTSALTPKLSYVPTIVFNGVYDKSVSKSAEKNLRQTICEHLEPKPELCS